MAASKPRLFNVFYGEEDYLLDRELQRALKWSKRAVTSLNGEAKNVTGDSIVSALEDLPLDEDRGVVVVVDNADKVKVTEGFLSYVEKKDPKDPSTVLVAICRCARLAKGWETIGKKGRITEHPKFKPWEKNKIKVRLLEEAELLGLKVEDTAFDVLHTIYGDQMPAMVNELRKMVHVVEKGAPITKEVVLSLCSLTFAVAPWDVSDAAFSKDSKKALRAASMLFQERGDDALVPVLAALMRQAEQTIVVRHLLDQQKSVEAIASALGIHTFRVQKEIPIARKHSVQSLVQQMRNLCELEPKIKGGAAAKRTLIEHALLAITA